MVSFTGSAAVGWQIKATAARKKVALELGGNAAVVVEPDCDWKAAIPKIAAAAFGYAGQSCISIQRILVHSDIHSAFRKALATHVTDHIRAGDPSEKSTIIGPMINAAERRENPRLDPRCRTPWRTFAHPDPPRRQFPARPGASGKCSL